MKKIFLSIFLLGILIIPLKNVKAITFNEISTKYKESMTTVKLMKHLEVSLILLKKMPL